MLLSLAVLSVLVHLPAMETGMTLDLASSGGSGSPSTSCREVEKLIPPQVVAFDELGNRMAMDGDVLVVGAWRANGPDPEAGAVYVYRRNGTTWKLEQRIVASDSKVGDRYFGGSVAVDGDLIVVGARHYNTPLINAGAAYLYRWDGTSWNEEAKLTASDAKAQENFGLSVAVAGDLVLVGGWNYADVFRWVGGTWLHEQELGRGSAGARDNFGFSVAISDGGILVGASHDGEKASESGAVHVFRWDGAEWRHEEKLVAWDGTGAEHLGTAMKAHGELLVAGAPGSIPGRGTGSAYVYRWDGVSWRGEAKLLPSDGMPRDRFGTDVAVRDGVIVVGSRWSDPAGEDSGAAYVYTRSGGGWSEQEKLVPADIEPQDQFGWSVAVSEGVIAVGSILDDDQGLSSGSVYLYRCELNSPPICEAGGGADGTTVECSGGRGIVSLDATASTDPDGDRLFYSWKSGSCPEALFSDDASPTPLLELAGPPPCPVACEVILEVDDGKTSAECGVGVEVRDSLAPEPAKGKIASCYATAADAEAAALAETTWRDACDAAVEESAEISGACEASVRVSGEDDCENRAVVDYRTRIDGNPPSVIAPSASELECENDLGLPRDHPGVQAWLAGVEYADDCGLASVGHDAPLLFGNDGCSGARGTKVAFTARDECAHETRATSRLAVVDTRAPRILAVGYDGMCLWPPNHAYVEIPDLVSLVAAEDPCDDDLDFEVVGCVSSEADDSRGSGKTDRDCEPTPDGKGILLRAERSGGEGAGDDGRRYLVRVRVTDDCGNAAVAEGTIRVPHDRRDRPECLRGGAPSLRR